MTFIERILRVPSYGWSNSNGELITPTKKQLLKEFFSRLNFIKSRRNWLAAASWGGLLVLSPFVYLFLTQYFSFTLLAIAFVYGMVGMGTQGTIWYHRYATHQAYKFKNKFWLLITKNLTPKMIPDEIYVVSHHVHHALSDKPGDPYNANGGWLYCFLADANHQLIATDLSEEDYNRTRKFMENTGARLNTYQEYKKWGSVSKPLDTILFTLLNYSFWFGVFMLIGGWPLTCALLTGSFAWGAGVRTFNFDGHGRGEDKQKEGVDFSRKDKSINQYWPGYVAGEWHNNHHLFPRSARSGFLKHQLDLAWVYIYSLNKIGGAHSIIDSKPRFLELYYRPYLQGKVPVAAHEVVIDEVRS